MKNKLDKPTLVFTGNEKDAFDFIPLVRKAFRSQCDYITHYKVVKEITDKRFWENIDWVKNILSKYVMLEKEGTQPKVKERKKRKPMTEEQRLAACERMKKAREAKGKK